MSGPAPAELEAVTSLHHQLFTGFILGLAGHHDLSTAAEFIYRTFRRQHDDRFLRGLQTLGLERLPPAIACARFIALSNRAGGLDVQYHEHSERKAWVRYPPPRWAYEGPAICALDNGISEAFLRGFHARCGTSLGNPRLRFVCTGMTTNGDAGLTGYFEEMPAPVNEEGRLVLRLGEPAPAFQAAADCSAHSSSARLAITRRNYAVRYIEVMIPVLLELLGREEGGALAGRCARLVGLQGGRDAVATLGTSVTCLADALELLAALNRGAGNAVGSMDSTRGRLVLSRFRLGADALVFDCWSSLYGGVVAAHQVGLEFRAIVGPGWAVRADA